MNTIAPGSPRLAAAKRFGDALQAAMARRRVGWQSLVDSAHVGRSAIVQWRMGRNLPTLETARRLAEALNDDRLFSICREGRTLTCDRCGKEFIHDGGGPRKFCSEICLRVAQMLRVDDRHPRTKLAEARSQLKAVRNDAQAVVAELTEHQVAVAEMCRGCEPEGYCRTPGCALRPISPLKLRVGGRIDAIEAQPAAGAWSPAHRERQLVAIRAANAKRWSREGEREAASEMHRQRHASMTEGERQEWIDKIKATKAAARQVPA